MRSVTYGCAFCGEDASAGRRQTFTEDCTVCCRPNLITLAFDDDADVSIEVTQEYEA